MPSLLILLVTPSLALPASVTAPGVLSWFADDVTAAISFVQAASATPQTSTAAVSVNYPLAQTLGDMNIVAVGWNDTTATVQSVTDTAGNSYKLAIGPTSGTALRQSIYYAPNIAGGGNTVTVAFNQAAAYPDIRILEYSGVNTLDVAAGASDSSASASSGPAKTASAPELIFGANTVATLTGAAGSGFTARIVSVPDGGLAEDLITTAAGSNAATAALNSAGPWVMQMATFAALTAPTVTSVSPNSGSTGGGTSVTITGTNFASGATVTFGGTAATNVAVVNTTTITATTPAGSAGAVTVTVTNPDGQSVSLANGFTYDVPAAISFVQAASATPQTSTAAVSVNYPLAQTLGDMNIVAVGWNDTTATVQSVTDATGNSYKLAIGPTSGTALRQSIYYAPNIAGGGNTVTVAFSQAAAYPDIRILEYSGVTALDVTAGASGSGTSASSGSTTTASSSELIFGANTVATGNNDAAGNGFTTRVITSPDSDLAEDMITTAVGNNAATAALTSAGPWVMQMASFTLTPAPKLTTSLAVSPISLDFGYVTDGSSATLPVSLSSTGTVPVIVSSVAISGSSYTFTGATFPVTLNPQLAITLEVTFAPMNVGPDLGTLTISSNSSSNPTATVSLSGTGQSALYEVDLAWNAPMNSIDPVVGYNIYRATDNSSSYQLLNSFVNAPTSFTDANVQNGSAYTYYVVSVDAQGNQSDPSSPVSVQIP